MTRTLDVLAAEMQFRRVEINFRHWRLVNGQWLDGVVELWIEGIQWAVDPMPYYSLETDWPRYAEWRTGIPVAGGNVSAGIISAFRLTEEEAAFLKVRTADFATALTRYVAELRATLDAPIKFDPVKTPALPPTRG